MDGERKALIVANDEYEHDGLQHLWSAAADADALAGVLGDPRIGGFTVEVARNRPAHDVGVQIEDLFSESRPDDVLLLHFSCHGLKDESGELYFATRNTRPNRLGSTAISAAFVQRCMRASRSRSIVLLLDCCYGGAFSQGVTVRAAGDVNLLDSFPVGRLGGGRGRAVITASSSIEYAVEGDQLADTHGPSPSVFTAALVEGLATGNADRDEDGWVSLNELYDYVFDKVRERNPHQTPSRDVEMQGELYLARSRRRRIRPMEVPPDLRAAMVDTNMFTRLGAVTELRSRLTGDNLQAAAGAFTALTEIADTDIRYVAEAAQAALREAAIRPDPPALHFGHTTVDGEPEHRTLRLLGPPVARACTPEASEAWIRVAETAEGFDVSVTAPGVGRIVLKGPTGEVTVPVEAEMAPAPVTAAPEPQPAPAPVESAPALADPTPASVTAAPEQAPVPVEPAPAPATAAPEPEPAPGPPDPTPGPADKATPETAPKAEPPPKAEPEPAPAEPEPTAVKARPVTVAPRAQEPTPQPQTQPAQEPSPKLQAPPAREAPRTQPPPAWRAALAGAGRRRAILAGVAVLVVTLATVLIVYNSLDDHGGDAASSGAPLPSIRALAFAPDGRTLATGSDDGTIQLWNPATGKPIGGYMSGNPRVTSVAFSPDGTLLASASDSVNTIRLWRTDTRQPLGERLTGHTGWVTSLAFSPKGELLASGSTDGTVARWDVGTGQRKLDPSPAAAAPSPAGNQVTSIAFSPDGTVLVGGGTDKTVRRWDPQNGKPLAPYTSGDLGSVVQVGFSPDGKWLVATSDSRILQLFYANNGDTLIPDMDETYGIEAFAFSPDGKYFAGSFESSGLVRVWDWTARKEVPVRLTGHSGEITSLAFSPDSKLLAVGTGRNTVRLWDPAAGTPVRDIPASATPSASPS